MTVRSYDSSRRRAAAAETRAAVIAAASELFAERGWAGTSMRDVAAAAGVAVETVYAGIGGKRELLKVCLDVGVVGDDEPEPLLSRPEFALLETGDLEERLAAMGRLLSRIYRRTSRLHGVLLAAAAGDAELAALQQRIREDQRTSFRAGIELITRRTASDVEVDGATAALGNESYLILTREFGWDQEAYETWVADTFRRLLVDERSS